MYLQRLALITHNWILGIQILPYLYCNRFETRSSAVRTRLFELWIIVIWYCVCRPRSIVHARHIQMLESCSRRLIDIFDSSVELRVVSSSMTFEYSKPLVERRCNLKRIIITGCSQKKRCRLRTPPFVFKFWSLNPLIAIHLSFQSMKIPITCICAFFAAAAKCFSTIVALLARFCSSICLEQRSWQDPIKISVAL